MKRILRFDSISKWVMMRDVASKKWHFEPNSPTFFRGPGYSLFLWLGDWLHQEFCISGGHTPAESTAFRSKGRCVGRHGGHGVHRGLQLLCGYPSSCESGVPCDPFSRRAGEYLYWGGCSWSCDGFPTWFFEGPTPFLVYCVLGSHFISNSAFFFLGGGAAIKCGQYGISD